jgi:hypothetical protein
MVTPQGKVCCHHEVLLCRVQTLCSVASFLNLQYKSTSIISSLKFLLHASHPPSILHISRPSTRIFPRLLRILDLNLLCRFHISSLLYRSNAQHRISQARRTHNVSRLRPCLHRRPRSRIHRTQLAACDWYPTIFGRR